MDSVFCSSAPTEKSDRSGTRVRVGGGVDEVDEGGTGGGQGRSKKGGLVFEGKCEGLNQDEIRKKWNVCF